MAGILKRNKIPLAVTRLLIKRMLAWGRPGLPPSGPVVPYRPSARPQRPTRGTRGHFVDGERKKKLMYFHGSERVLRLLYGAEVGQAAVGTRCGVGEPNQAAIDRNEASRGCRRCRRRGSRRRATSRGAPPMPAAAAEEETSPVGARRAPLCPSATASRSDRGSPFASEFVLSPRALDWVAPIRAPRSLIRCAVVTWIVPPLQCDHGGDAEHQHREVSNRARAPHQESGETAFFIFYYLPHFSLQSFLNGNS